MANFSFALRLALGLLPKTEKVEGQYNDLVAEYQKLNEYKNSDELKAFNELSQFANSAELKKLKADLAAKTYKGSNIEKAELRYKSLKKDKNIVNYFKVLNSQDLKRLQQVEASDKLARFNDLSKNIAELKQAQPDADLDKELKSLSKDSDIKFYNKFINKSKYQQYLRTKESSLLTELADLETSINSAEFAQEKAYLLDKDKYSKTDEAKKEQQYTELLNSANIKWFKSVVDSNKFDQLNAWKLTFEDDFSAAKVDDSKWMNSFLWGKMGINDSYVINGEKQVHTDGKNFEIANSVLNIVTKKEKASGKVWNDKAGFIQREFDYTSGMINTAQTFRQKCGRFEAKIKIDAEAPVYQAFWLKGEKITPQIDIFKYNVGKNGKMQMSAYDGKNTVGTKFGGKALSKDFFIYSIEWDQKQITWKVNGVEILTSSNVLPNEPLYIVLSAGLMRDADNLPSKMQIDWVRCFEKA